VLRGAFNVRNGPFIKDPLYWQSPWTQAHQPEHVSRERSVNGA